MNPILTMWDDPPAPPDVFSANRLRCARHSCRMLKKLTRLPQSSQLRLAGMIARLSRNALLTLKQRQAI